MGVSAACLLPGGRTGEGPDPLDVEAVSPAQDVTDVTPDLRSGVGGVLECADPHLTQGGLDGAAQPGCCCRDCLQAARAGRSSTRRAGGATPAPPSDVPVTAEPSVHASMSGGGRAWWIQPRLGVGQEGRCVWSGAFAASG